MALLDELFGNINAGASNLVQNASVVGRDIGRSVSNFLKPDGTPASFVADALSLPRGNAEVVTNLIEERAVDPIINAASSSIKRESGKTSTKGGVNLQNLVPNPLENFASYNALWTMSVLKPDQFNKPDTYRTESPDSLSNVIFSSGGRFDSQRAKTFFGTPEYFVNNFVMRSTISASEKTGNSNAVKFEFDIYEPYSFGLFLQSLQNAALAAGYANYLDNTPYMLRLDIVGFNERGQRLGTPSTEFISNGGFLNAIRPKFFVMKLSSVKFDVNEGGSNYKVVAIPYNHQAFADATNTLFTDIKISPDKDGTVKEVLVTGKNSLCAVLNKNEERLVAEKKISIPDVYEVQFPEKSSDFISRSRLPVEKRATQPATPDQSDAETRRLNRQANNGANSSTQVLTGTSIAIQTDFGNNPIGNAKFGFEQGKGGNFVFKKEGDVRDEKTGLITRDKMSIDPKTRAFHFAQSQSINDIIVQTILSSDYVKSAMDPDNITADGFIKWFRLDVQIEFGGFDELIGDYAKKIIYRVVPFLVHHSIFSNPNSPPVGYNLLEKKICKRYDYIYTGQNIDILKFDIQINNLFYTGSNFSPESATPTEVNKDQQGIAATATAGTRAGKGSDPKAQTANAGRSRNFADPKAAKDKPKGGANTKDTTQLVAESFHQAFVKGSSADLISVDLEIIGDPYWLVDGGMSNHFAKPVTENALITEDGTANYEGSDVYIYLAFKTPSDINEAKGNYEFALAGKDSPFGGIYRVSQCESTFADGLFKQKLKCHRMPGQPADYDGEALTTDKTEALQTVPGDIKQPAEQPYPDINPRDRR